jgi:hypothetical protein
MDAWCGPETDTYPRRDSPSELYACLAPALRFRATPTSPMASTHRIVATSELTGRSKTRNGDVRPSAPIILRSGVTCSVEAQQRRREDRRQQRPTGRLCEASGYLALNNGERQFVPKCLAPHNEFELRLTTLTRRTGTMSASSDKGWYAALIDLPIAPAR